MGTDVPRNDQRQWMLCQKAFNKCILDKIKSNYIMSLILNVMIAGQRKKTTLLIQEILLLKEEIEKLKNNK